MRSLAETAAQLAWPPVMLVVLALLIACSETVEEAESDSSPEAPDPAAVSATTSGMQMSDRAAEDAALRESGYIIQDGEIASKSAEAMRWDEAIERVGGPAAVEREGDMRVWLVTLRGVFTPPGGPVQYTDAKPVVPICSEIRTIIDDATGKSLLLIYGPADSC